MSDHRRRATAFQLGVLFVIALGAAAPAVAATIVSCPNSGGGGDQVTRGFYVQNYNGSTLDTVALTFVTGGGVGSYSVSLTAHAGAYDGPVIGTTQTANFTETGGLATYSFGSAPVVSGSTVAFVMVLTSSPAGGSVFFDVGTCGLGDAACATCPGVFETEDTTPPLSTFRRGSVGLAITGQAPGAGAGQVVPALTPWALAALGVALALVAVGVLRKTPI
jgi:hypothetical protein